MCRGLRLPPQAAFKTRILHCSTARWDWAVEARDVEFSATFLAADAEAVLVVAARLHAAAAAAPALLSRCVVIAARVRVPRDTHAQARARARARPLRCAHTRSHTNGACARARMLAHTICWG